MDSARSFVLCSGRVSPLPRPTPRRPLVPLALAALVGAALAPPLALLGAGPRLWTVLAGLALPVAGHALRSGRAPGRVPQAALLLACAGLFGLRSAQVLEDRPRGDPPPGPCAVEGRLLEAPRLQRGGVELRIGLPGGARLEVDAAPAAGRLLAGARVRVEGVFAATWRLRATRVEALTPGWGPGAVLGAAEQHARRQIGRAASTRGSAFLRTVLLGDRAPLDPSLAGAFRDTGAAHLLSISGLHVGLVAGLSLALARSLRRPRGERRLTAALAILAYAAVAGARVPILRASLAGLAVCAAPARGEAWNRLALGLLVVLAWDPRCWTGIDLLLSFGVTAGFLLLSPLWRGTHAPGLRGRATHLAVGVAIPFLASVPLVWACLGQLSPASLLANALAVPLCALVLGLGLAGVLLGALLPSAGLLLLGLADRVCAGLFALLERLAALPAARLDLVRPPAWLAVLAGGLLLLGAARRERGAGGRVCLGLSALLALSALAGRPDPDRAAPARRPVRLLARPDGSAALLAGPSREAVALGRVRLDAWRDEALRRLACQGLRAAPTGESEVYPGVWLAAEGRLWILRAGPASAGAPVLLLLAPSGANEAQAERARRRLSPQRALIHQRPGHPPPPGWEALDPRPIELYPTPP